MHIEEKIASSSVPGMKFGRDMTRSLLNKIGSPDDALKIVHIAGTNGKGSIAEYMTRILMRAGKKVGTFTSPKVLDFCDQFRVDGAPLDEAVLSRYTDRAIANGEGCTAFELMTAGALLAFEGEGCEYAVLECGLGGLEDATNAVNSKEVAIISSIGLEHTAILGGTIEEICAHKAGIIANCPAVISALQPDEAKKFFFGKGKFAGPVELLSEDESGMTFAYDGEEYAVKMHGFAQIYNAACAIEAAKLLGIDGRCIKLGLSDAFLPARLQILRRGGSVYIVDGAHNPSSFAPLSAMLEKFDDVTVIFGCLSDKDVEGDLKALYRAARIKVVRPNSVRAMDPSRIVAACKKFFDNVSVESSVTRALENSQGTVVVCGSFTLAKEALNWIEKGQ